MDTKKLFKLLGVVLTVALLGAVVASPAYATTDEVRLEGTIEKIIKVDMLPEGMMRDHLMEHGIVKILKVDGVWVLIDGDTDREGKLEVGAEVDTRGTLKKLLATTITVVDDGEADLRIDDLDVELTGTIDKVIYHGPAIVGIKVDGIKVIICPKTTMIEGMLKKGATVEVEGTVKAFLATEVRVR